MRNLILHGEKDAAQVRIDYVVPFLRAVLVQRPYQCYPRVIKRDVETAILINDLVDEVSNLGLYADISSDVGGFSALQANLLFNFASKVFAATAESNPGTFRGEGECGGPANSRSRAGDDYDSFVKTPFQRPGRTCWMLRLRTSTE